MEIALDLQKRVEAYLRTVVTALQQEALAPKQVDRAADMLREQIFETLHERAEGEEVNASLVENVLAEMPSPGEFALEAAQVAGTARKPTDSGVFERLARLLALVLTVAIFGLCMEGTVWGVKSLLAEDSAESQATPVENESATGAADEDIDDGDFVPGFLFFLAGLLVILLVIMGMVAVVVFGAGAVLLGCSLGTLNAAVSLHRKSWLTFLRLCVWELPVAAGSFGGMVLGAGVWVLREPASWRVCGYIGLATGAAAGLIGAWIAIWLLNRIAALIIRHKQRHLPMLKLVALQKMESLVSSSRKL